MGILRNLFGWLTAKIVRLVILAVVLLCAYLFIVQPLWNKADDAIHSGPKRLIHCVEHAKQDTKKLERCTRRF